MKLFDENKIIKNRAKVEKNPTEYQRFCATILEEILNNLDCLSKIKPKKILYLGLVVNICDCIAKKHPDADIFFAANVVTFGNIADNFIDIKPYKYHDLKTKYQNNATKKCYDGDAKFDIIIVPFLFHHANEIQIIMHQISNLLQENGLLFCTFYGPKTLMELRHAMLEFDEQKHKEIHQRIMPMIDIKDAARLLLSCGLQQIVTNSEKIELDFKSIFTLLKKIQSIGEGDCLNGAAKKLYKKDILAIETIYKTRFSADGVMKATLEIIYCMGMSAPSAS